jgi:RNA polymerase sigma-70 factor (ECF subfamily)
LEDNELLALFKSDDKRHYAFNQLVLKYQRKVYMVVRKMVIVHEDADDITQDVFVKIWHSLDEFKGQSALFTWLYRIAVNEALAHLRRKRTRFFLPIHDVEGELMQHLSAPSAYLDGDEAALKLQKALLTLPEKQRLVFNLKYFDDLTYEQMAEITNTSVGALKASYHHAVKKIETHLKAS